jgi:sortase A
MKKSSRKLRRVEIALWILGLSLLGVALGTTVQRWKYQAEQERAFLRVAEASQRAHEAPERAAPPLTPPPEGEAAKTPVFPEALVEEAPEALVERVPEQTDVSPTPQAVKPRREVVTSRPPDQDLTLDPDLLGRIEIPRLRMSAIVRTGDDEATLQKAVGLVAGTPRPGEGGNTALAGHRDTFFRPLQKIKVDDRIRLVVPPHTYEYRVDSLQVVEPHEVSVLDSTGIEELTLVTCYPFRYIGPAPDRFIVKATRVQ